MAVTSRVGCPPRPGLSAEALGQRALIVKQRRQRMIHKDPHFEKPFRKEVLTTPTSTIDFILREQVQSLNPPGKHCCFWHASLAYLQTVVCQLVVKPCKPVVQPNLGWQCTRCQ